MSTNSVKLWKKFPLVLWLTSVLCLVSCSSQKQLSRTETDRVINKDVREQIDSLARLAIQEQAERLLNTLEEQETTLILFDTDKPPVDSTGMPPVKAIARQEVKREEQRQEKQQRQVQSETEQKEETIDKSVEETATTVEVEEAASWWVKFHECLGWILTISVMIILIYGLYELIKFFK